MARRALPPAPSPSAITAMLRELWAGEPGKHHCYVGDGRDLPAAVARARARAARAAGRRGRRTGRHPARRTTRTRGMR